MAFITLKRKLWLKGVTVFLIISLTNQIVFPLAAFALTAGPTAPEATSFEPIDTNSMVNDLTGDFVYNMPLIEVPGPDGGYPLSLSYHAGIQPNEEASWVGLGWTLNPGAIARSVNGFPDDWRAARASRRDYWEGGITTTKRWGVNVPLVPGFMNVTVGQATSHDTYMGIQRGMIMGVGIGVKGFQLGMQMDDLSGTSSLYAGYMGFGASVTMDGNDKASYGLNAGNLSLSGLGSSSVTLGVSGALGASLTSDGTRSFSIGGFSSFSGNSNAGRISTETNGISVDLGLFFYSKQKTRYWSDETESSFVYGALDPLPASNNIGTGTPIPDDYVFDNYADLSSSIAYEPDAEKEEGGIYPSFDLYQVTAQGLGGMMRPYRFRGETSIQNKYQYEGDEKKTYVQYYSVYNNGGTTPGFRFENDFSNNYIQTYPNIGSSGETLKTATPPFSGPVYQNASWLDGYSNGALTGSKHIEYFITNSDGSISNLNNSPFIKPVVIGLDRVKHMRFPKHIAGFAITNSSGVTYHYNLPAYSYGEEVYQENEFKTHGLRFNRQARTEGYAYTWYLTAITGPDYVDRGSLGQLDDNDYGYWVSFDYGKWSDKYVWRSPSEGFVRDDDSNFQCVSMGSKEVYYLNSVRTRTHVAIFEKSLRNDAKGSSPEIFYKNVSSQNNVRTDYQNQGVFNANSNQNLRLDKVYLLKIADFQNLAAVGGSGNYIPAGRTISCPECELDANVIDKRDVDIYGRTLLESKAIRIVDFDYNYSLAKSTANSFDVSNPSFKLGKLTLTAVTSRGKGGLVTAPPTQFSYELNSYELKRSSGSLTYTNNSNSATFSTTESGLKVGDLLITDDSAETFCGVIMASSYSGGRYVYTLKNGSYSGSYANINLRTTKNPPYNKDRYDCWGFYKSDYSKSSNENASRLTSPISNNAADVWSLRTIKNSLGAETKIRYEGDTYSSAVINSNHSLTVTNVTNMGDNKISMVVNDIPEGLSLTDLYQNGDFVDIYLFVIDDIPPSYNGYKPARWISSENYDNPRIVGIDVGSCKLIMQCASEMIGELYENAYSYGYPVTVATGNLKFTGGQRNYGGGVRVESIYLDNMDGRTTRRSYNYNKPSSYPSVSSGVTSYEPISLDEDLLDSYYSPILYEHKRYARQYRWLLYRGMSDIMANSREIPPPGVMYEYITQRTDNNGLYSVKQFEVFNKNMITTTSGGLGTSVSRPQGGFYLTRNLVKRKYTANIGALKKKSDYNATSQLLRVAENHYLGDNIFLDSYAQKLNERFANQGVIKERYYHVKEARKDNFGFTTYYYNLLSIFSAREEYPAVLISQTVKDYVTGIETSSENMAFDFYSGEVTKNIYTDIYGNRFLKEVLPAYRIYNGMGLKIKSINNKFMLTQEAGNYLYKIDNNNNKSGILSASVQLWGTTTPVIGLSENTIAQDGSNGEGIVWRKMETLQWKPEGLTQDGITPLSDFVDISWNSQTQHNFWKRTSKKTLYSIFSDLLESVDLNGIYSSSKLGYNGNNVVISGVNAAFNEIAFAGFEDGLVSNGKLSTNVNYISGSIAGVTAHSGSKSLILAPNQTGISYDLPVSSLRSIGRDYIASVWFQTNANNLSAAKLYYTVGSNTGFATLNAQKLAKGWYLLELKIPGTVLTDPDKVLSVKCTNVLGSADIFFDDFRFQPLQSQVNSFVYDPLSGELTYILDNNNLFTQFEYDAAGRLIKIYRETFGKNSAPLIKENIYNYKQN